MNRNRKMFGEDVPKVELFWIKVGGINKWAGFERKDGKRVHVASVLEAEPGLYKVWVDGGNGFQKLQNPDAYGFVGYPGTAKEVASVALADLRARIAAGEAQ